MRMNAVRVVTERLNQASPEWEHSDLTGEAAVWRDTGIIRATGRWSCVKCTCGETHDAEVEDGYAYCSFTGHRFRVKPEDLLVYTFQPNRMVEVLTELMKCREEPVEVIPARLWKMGKSGVPIVGRSRDIFFAPCMTGNARDIYDALPNTKTPLLIVGSSRLSPDTGNRFDDSRIVMLDSVLTIEGGALMLDFDWLGSQVSDAIEDTVTPKRKESRGDTVEHLQHTLDLYLEAAFSNYCVELNRGHGRQMLEPRLTLSALAEMAGISTGWCSHILELKKPIEKCRHMQLRHAWDSTQDIDLMVAYGKKHWGKKNRGWNQV